MIITTWTLVNIFLLGLTLLCSTVVLILASTQRIRLWYAIFILSFIGWSPAFLKSDQSTVWLWIFPLFWLIGTLSMGFTTLSIQVFPPQLKEPSFTQEYLQGRKGTVNALRLYFTLLFIVLIMALLFHGISTFYY